MRNKQFGSFMTCFLVDRFESRMTPRFLAESEKGM